MNRFALVVVSTTLALSATLDMAAQSQSQAPVKQEFFPAHPVVATGQINPAASSLIAEMMPFIGPMFVNGPEIKSTLVLANASRGATSVTVTLHGADGSVINRQRLPMKAHEHVELSLNLYPTLPVIETWGSVSVEQDPSAMGTVVAGQVVITDTRGAIPVYVDEELAMPEMEGSSRLLAVTDQSDGPPLVAVTNLSSQTQHLSLACILGQNSPVLSKTEIGAHASIKLQGCSALNPANIAGYASAMNGQDSPGIYGIQIEGDGDPGSLAAFALAPHKRGSDLVFSSVPFYDPAEIHSSTVVFAGVPIGAQDTLPAGVYVPRLSLANFSDKTETFSVIMADTITSPVRDAAGRDQPPAVNLLKTLSVPAHQTIEYVFTGQEAQNGLLHSIMVSTEAAPGTYQAKLVSRSDGRLFQVELLAKDALDNSDAGVHPWSSVEGTESHIILFNHSKSDKKVGVYITGGPQEWAKEFVLAATETREISINEIADRQIPDDHGVRLPKSTKQGVINWMTPELGDVTGRLMVTSRDAAMARNFSCGNYVSECGLQFNTYAYTVGEGSTFSMYGAQGALCINSQPLECGNSNPTSGVSNYSWSVGATSVIKLSSSSQSTLQSPALTGVSVGNGYADVTAYAGQCQASGQGSPNVISVSQSPSLISMSSGDKNQAITVAISPVSAASGSAISYGLHSNLNSSSTATLSFTRPGSFTGTDSWPIVISGTNSPSGIFTASACTDGICSGQNTTITVPPQLIIQMMYAEANGTGNETAMESLGETIDNRFFSSYFSSQFSTWQNALVPSQVALNTSITTGVQPELTAAVDAYTQLDGGWCSALAWWSPTSTEWTIVQAAISSKTTVFPTGLSAPVYSTWPTSSQRIVYSSSVGAKASGVPNFLYLAPRTSSQSAAVSASCD